MDRESDMTATYYSRHRAACIAAADAYRKLNGRAKRRCACGEGISGQCEPCAARRRKGGEP